MLQNMVSDKDSSVIIYLQWTISILLLVLIAVTVIAKNFDH